ncbi:hypothetical protein V1639_04205 [Pseudarthrobacter sp. J75]|uniref:hypothetical protein n=1 Tax=Pseudarthrobacter sp. J75 TaxID=3116486 RepID=UPI002E80D1C1|nr:hypothetical protein [Pseudarthrobacter sp. J75]MEE2528235.1 hypothetical protein [Pseudarthrobacter sp. J75]
MDQAVLSIASVVFLIVAAQFGSSEDLGSFVLGLSTAVLMQSLTRAICGETLLVRSTRQDFRDDEVGYSLSLALIISLTVAGVLLAVTLTFPELGLFCGSLAVAQFGLIFQDAVRFANLARGRSMSLIIADTAYAVATCSGIYLAGYSGFGSNGMLLALGIGAGIVGFVGALTGKMSLRFRAGVVWLVHHWRLNSSFVSEAAIGAILGYSVTLVLNFYVSGAELAAYRSVLSIFGFTSLAINFLRTMVLRDLRASSVARWRSFWHKSILMGSLVMVTVGVTYAILAFIPSTVGSLLFGGTWQLMSVLFAAAAVNRMFAGLSIIPTIFLRVQGVTWRATIVRIALTLCGFGVSPVGAFLAGAEGALLAEAVLYLALTLTLMRLSRQAAAGGKHRRTST